MSTELELAQAKIKELSDRLKAFAALEEHLIPLPNGDLHRGFKNRASLANIDVDVIPDNMGNPLDRAMAKILKAATGGNALTCLWCGLQWGVPGAQNTGQEQAVREHLKKDHPSVVEGYEKLTNDVLMAAMSEAQDRLKELETA
jgi:hypothetical protein